MQGKNGRCKQRAANSRETDPQGKALALSKKRSSCMLSEHFESVF